MMIQDFHDKFDLSFTMSDVASGHPLMSRWDEETDTTFFRHLTDNENKTIVTEEITFRFPCRYDPEVADYYHYETYAVPKKEWDAGQRWTTERVLKFMRSVYSKNNRKNIKMLGDHQFFEGFDGNTIHLGS
jgi:hypothetical protein